MGFPRHEYWSGLPFPSPGDLPIPGVEPGSPALAGGFFFFLITEPPGKLGSSFESENLVAQLRPTLCGPWAVARQAPPSLGFSRQEWVAIFFSKAAALLR